MTKKISHLSLPVFLIALSIAFSPSLSFGELGGHQAFEIWIEDILLLVFVSIWLASLLLSRNSTTIQKPQLALPISTWLSFLAISLLINIILNNINAARGVFFFLKEVEFFILYFYIYAHLKHDSVPSLIRLWIALGALNGLWILFQYFINLKITYYYGPTAIVEPESPFISGGFFLLIFIFLLNVLLFHYLPTTAHRIKKLFISLLIAMPAIGIISSGSRTSFFGLIVALLSTIMLYSFKKFRWKTLLKTILLLSVLSISSLVLLIKIPGGSRILNVNSIQGELTGTVANSRLNIWKKSGLFILDHPFGLIFGLGKSSVSRNMQPHNQYLQILIESGVVGVVIFITLLLIILKKTFTAFLYGKDTIRVACAAGLFSITIAMLVLSIGAEAFRTIKLSELYWFFTALTMVALYPQRRFKNPTV